MSLLDPGLPGFSAANTITNKKSSVDALNVFPVPDGDTGTNMSMTINAAASDLRKTEDPDLEKASKVAASAMLRGARGNSGVILSLLFRGISKRLKGSEECDGVLWAQALQEGSGKSSHYSNTVLKKNKKQMI